MCYHLKTPQGNTEAVIDDNCGISKFYAIANTLSNGLNVRFEKRVDDAESLDWEFNYKNQLLTLHYSIFNGVSIYPHHRKSIQQENNAVIEIAHFLEKMAY